MQAGEQDGDDDIDDTETAEEVEPKQKRITGERLITLEPLVYTVTLFSGHFAFKNIRKAGYVLSKCEHVPGWGGRVPCTVRSKLNKFEHVGGGSRAPWTE